MKEIDKIRIRQWNQDNPYIQMKNLEMHSLDTVFIQSMMIIICMNFRWKHRILSLTGYSGIFIRHRKSIRILPVMI